MSDIERDDAARPRIGLTTSPGRSETGSADMVDHAYVTSIVAAGGTPVMLPVLDPAFATDVLAMLDGIVFTGGGDVDPTRYGQEPDPSVAGVDAARDRWELALATRLEIPALAICRGAQLVNVAFGGTLVQDLPERDTWVHRSADRPGEEVHHVEVAEDSRLRGVLGLGSLRVNTLHHQSVDEVGSGLRVVGRADDGTVEAIEAVDHPLLGVQWHPELLFDRPPNQALFEWLVEEARASAAAGQVDDGGLRLGRRDLQ